MGSGTTMVVPQMSASCPANVKNERGVMSPSGQEGGGGAVGGGQRSLGRTLLVVGSKVMVIGVKGHDEMSCRGVTSFVLSNGWVKGHDRVFVLQSCLHTFKFVPSVLVTDMRGVKGHDSLVERLMFIKFAPSGLFHQRLF